MTGAVYQPNGVADSNDRHKDVLSYYQRAMLALRTGKPDEAQILLANEIIENPRNADAWLLWSKVTPVPEFRAIYLRQVLRLEPTHAQARQQLKALFGLVDPELLRAYDITSTHESGIDNQAFHIAAITAISELLPTTSMLRDVRSRVHWPEPLIPAPVVVNASETPRVHSVVYESEWTKAPSIESSKIKDSSNSRETPPRSSSGEPIAANGAEKRTQPEKTHKDAPNSREVTPKSSNGELATDNVTATNPQRLENAHLALAVEGVSALIAADTIQLTEAWWIGGVRFFDRAGDQSNRLAVALAYLVALTVAEALTVFVEPRLGVITHLLLLLVMMIHTVRRWDYPDHRLWLSLTMMPLIRIISLSLPLVTFSLPYWFLFTSIPLFAAAFLGMRLLDLSWTDVGVTTKGLPLQLLIGLIGIVLGFVEYQILRPEPLISEPTWQQFVWPAIIILISTGFLEELVFRGIVQGTAVEQLGAAIGVVYVAVYFAVLHFGYKSIIDVVFVLVVGLMFGWLVLKTKSIVGVTIAHGLTNIVLFLVMPFVAGALVSPF